MLDASSTRDHQALRQAKAAPSITMYHQARACHHFQARRPCRLKQEAEEKDKWMMLNVQDPQNFQSLQLNADLWADQLVKSVVADSFQFAQRILPSEDAKQVQQSYHLAVLPAIIIVDPNTGQKMHEWLGLPDKERFMEALIPFMDIPPSSPKAGAPLATYVRACPPVRMEVRGHLLSRNVLQARW